MKSSVLLVTAMVVGVGCSRNRTDVEVGPPAPAAATPPATTASLPSDDARATEEDARRAEAARRRAVLEERVHFEFNRSNITDQAQSILDRKVPILSSDQAIRLRIDGHADERGSVEYNLALSLRRANAVRTYFVDAGLSPTRFQVAAFGEEQPIQRGSDVTSWAANRRAEFRIVSGL